MGSHSAPSAGYCSSPSACTHKLLLAWAAVGRARPHLQGRPVQLQKTHLAQEVSAAYGQSARFFVHQHPAQVMISCKCSPSWTQWPFYCWTVPVRMAAGSSLWHHRPGLLLLRKSSHCLHCQCARGWANITNAAAHAAAHAPSRQQQ
jgi:hypothetical protein